MLTKSIIVALTAASLAQGAAVDSGLYERQLPPGSPCNRDYCLRALVASQTPGRLETAIADCTSYFWATETPVTNTITNTVTDTATSTLTVESTTTITFAPLVRRQAGFTLPSYATSCSGFARWSSACSCLGVTSSTSTLPTPSTTVDATITETVTATVASATASPTVFRLRRYTPGTPDSNNQYLYADEANRLFYWNSTPQTFFTYFTFDPVTGYLWNGNKVAKGLNVKSQVVTFVPVDAVGIPYVCSISGPSNTFTCTLTPVSNGGTRQWGFTGNSGKQFIAHGLPADNPGIQIYIKAI